MELVLDGAVTLLRTIRTCTSAGETGLDSNPTRASGNSGPRSLVGVRQRGAILRGYVRGEGDPGQTDPSGFFLMAGQGITRHLWGGLRRVCDSNGIKGVCRGAGGWSC